MSRGEEREPRWSQRECGTTRDGGGWLACPTRLCAEGKRLCESKAGSCRDDRGRGREAKARGEGSAEGLTCSSTQPDSHQSALLTFVSFVSDPQHAGTANTTPLPAAHPSPGSPPPPRSTRLPLLAVLTGHWCLTVVPCQLPPPLGDPSPRPAPSRAPRLAPPPPPSHHHSTTPSLAPLHALAAPSSPQPPREPQQPQRRAAHPQPSGPRALSAPPRPRPPPCQHAHPPRQNPGPAPARRRASLRSGVAPQVEQRA